MTNIIKRVGKKINCPNCSHALKYSWLSRINKDWVSLYSKAGDAVLVSKELTRAAASEGELSKGVSIYEVKHGIDAVHQFSVRNEMKCPNCNYPLTSRSGEKFEDIVGGRVVFLEGMTFINDENEYRVEIDAR
ncbi:hypothetical protein [Vreelandella zhaodongensis]|uniref:hypothetical protein n=1 Tax=Vreelandella zhaodongensis TaxID=1176240 RepID=UPI003EBDE6D8